MNYGFTLLIATVFVTMSCSNEDSSEDQTNMPRTPLLSYHIVSAFPHDTASYTQGIEFYNGAMLESTGQYNQSKLRLIDVNNWQVIKEVTLNPKHFGEGLTVLNDTIYQLTWQERLVLIYSAKNLAKIGELPLKTEGWGMTNDGTHLIVTDGSSNLYFYEPGTFRLLRVQAVTENGSPAVNLNELEFINGYVYANQWQYHYILKIDPATGEVVAKLDLSDLVAQVKAREPKSDVLNGIAYNPENKKVYITGKNWSQIYEIRFEL